MTTASPTLSPPAAAGATRRSLVASLVGAMLLGALMIFATGFSHSEIAHNAAHDARHANAFPCH